jgi:hypothetical protein
MFLIVIVPAENQLGHLSACAISPRLRSRPRNSTKLLGFVRRRIGHGKDGLGTVTVHPRQLVLGRRQLIGLRWPPAGSCPQTENSSYLSVPKAPHNGDLCATQLSV